ncbi:MAG TPA: hypothetical protein ENI80_06330 [Acidiferrobacteraceae bacterium]|nr:hypothetical protein [Acidiferrobacteraceae bacterium]
MKKILITCLVLIFASITVLAKDAINKKETPQFLYVLSAKAGSFEEKTLTLKDVPLVIYFSDRPARIAGHMSLKEFVKMWGKGKDSFKKNPPNATLSIFNEKGGKDVVIEISAPQIKDDVLSFSARLLEGKASQSFGAVSLFIDNSDYKQRKTPGVY